MTIPIKLVTKVTHHTHEIKTVIMERIMLVIAYPSSYGLFFVVYHTKEQKWIMLGMVQ